MFHFQEWVNRKAFTEGNMSLMYIGTNEISDAVLFRFFKPISTQRIKQKNGSPLQKMIHTRNLTYIA
jgi:hypothetical protein